MRVLVTGAAGFIGSHVVDALVSAGHDVIGMDSLDPRVHPETPVYLDPAVPLERFDLRDRARLGRLVAGVDAVSHQASLVGLGTSFSDVVDFVGHNDLGTAVLLAALHATGFRGRFALASSMVVYGEGAYHCARHGAVRPGPRSREALEKGRFEPPCPSCGLDLRAEAVTEDTPTDPRNVYAATKVHQEHLCSALARETGAGVAALRYHNVYGPRMPRETPYAGVASIFRSAMEAGAAATIFEDGEQMRDFVHVRDVAGANVAALEAGGPPGFTAFNIASGRPRSVGEMALALAHAASGREPVVSGEFRLGDVRHIFASPRRAASAYGFEARVGFEEGMRELAHAPLRGSADGRSDHGPAREPLHEVTKPGRWRPP